MAVNIRITASFVVIRVGYINKIRIMKLIDKAAVVAEIERRKRKLLDNIICEGDKEWVVRTAHQLNRILLFLDTLEWKEVDLELITGWFDHIAQIADDRMTLTNQRMTDAHALDEIKCLAKNSSEFITKHYKAQKGE